MERQKGMTPSRSLQKELFKSKQAISIIIWFHVIGLIGLSIMATRAIFLGIVPFHLLLMSIIVVISHSKVNNRFLFFGLIIYTLGFCAEWIGIHQHSLFGDYFYGKTLGPKLSGVPLIIGINWLLLSYSAGVLMQRSRVKAMSLRILAGAVVLVLLDLLIEPVATRFDYWHWANGNIPFKNYLCWFFMSIAMLTIFELFRFRKQNIVAPVLLFSEFIFFGILYAVQVIFLL